MGLVADISVLSIANLVVFHFSGCIRGACPKTVADTPAHSVLRCLVSGGVWHCAALVVSRASVDLTHHFSYTPSLVPVCMYCVPWGGALSHNKLDTKKKKKVFPILGVLKCYEYLIAKLRLVLLTQVSKQFSPH